MALNDFFESQENPNQFDLDSVQKKEPLPPFFLESLLQSQDSSSSSSSSSCSCSSSSSSSCSDSCSDSSLRENCPLSLSNSNQLDQSCCQSYQISSQNKELIDQIVQSYFIL